MFALDADAPDLFALIDIPQAREAGEGGLEVVTRLGEESLAVVPLWVNEAGWRERPDAPPFDPQRPLERRREGVDAGDGRRPLQADVAPAGGMHLAEAGSEATHVRDGDVGVEGATGQVLEGDEAPTVGGEHAGQSQ